MARVAESGRAYFTVVHKNLKSRIGQRRLLPSCFLDVAASVPPARRRRFAFSGLTADLMVSFTKRRWGGNAAEEL